jgi:hypothetical protein
MDPVALTGPQWTDIGDLLTRLWVVVGLVVFIATNMLIGHILIPSLVASSHLPMELQKTRPVFYLLATMGGAATVFVLFQVVTLARVLDSFWPDYWI